MTSLIKTSQKEKLEVLDTTDLLERFKIAQPLLLKQIEVCNIVFIQIITAFCNLSPYS